VVPCPALPFAVVGKPSSLRWPQISSCTAGGAAVHAPVSLPSTQHSRSRRCCCSSWLHLQAGRAATKPGQSAVQHSGTKCLPYLAWARAERSSQSRTAGVAEVDRVDGAAMAPGSGLLICMCRMPKAGQQTARHTMHMGSGCMQATHRPRHAG